MAKYYINGEEVSEEEFIRLAGDKTARKYSGRVYRGLMTIEEVPEDQQEAVAAAVAARIETYGAYEAKATEADYQSALKEFGVTINEEA